MKQVLQSLQAISTGYSVFEKDQVLTHDQLNTVSDYFDDQTRLTRVKLLGVGIVCGLRVSVEETNLTVSKGAGVTTDGDLLYFTADTVFDRFQPYDKSNPTYAHFAAALNADKVFELVPRNSETPQGPKGLSQFKAQTGFALDQMVAVLFMEGYVKDEDVCTGTDCDNLGQNFINTIKLLLVEKSVAGSLHKNIPTPDQTVRALVEIAADRALIPSQLTSTNQLTTIYRTTCQRIHGKLIGEFAKLDKTFWASFGDSFAPTIARDWTATLNRIKTAFTGNASGIQYYYDFLKDLVETYNHFRQLLSGDTTWCCPDAGSFPKHLLLGNVGAGANPDENRTGFYPSPLASRTVEQWNHATFLAQKLDALIQTFQPPSATATVRITPSRFEDAHLEERAIPYYYPVNDVNPIQTRWSYCLHKQGMDAWNYSYHAASYNPPLGGAANPLASQTGCYSFFRIEGHLGQLVSTAQAAIEAEIKASNLPFVVQPVHLGTDLRRVVKRPGVRYSDLHSLHHILRQELAYRLDDVKTFSTNFAAQVNTLTPDDVDDPPQLKILARQKDEAIGNEVVSAKAVLNQTYPEYKLNAAAWKPAFEKTITTAAEFKQNLGQVTKTEFPTPFDSLISTSHGCWLDWLDTIIADKGDKDDAKLLFSNFQALHPGLEHFAGVVRGGTFVLVYDNNDRVIADFMLPYHCCEAVPEIEPQEPGLPRPKIKIGSLPGGIKMIPTIDKLFTGKLTQFTRAVIDPKIEVQKQNFEFFKSSMTAVAGVFGAANTGRIKAGEPIFADALLDAAVNETKLKQQRLDILKERAGDPRLPKEARDKYAAQAKKAEADLAKSIQDSVKYVSESGVDVSSGSEGFKAVMEISAGIGKISDQRTKTSLKTGLTTLQKKIGDAGLKTMLGGMINF